MSKYIKFIFEVLRSNEPITFFYDVEVYDDVDYEETRENCEGNCTLMCNSTGEQSEKCACIKEGTDDGRRQFVIAKENKEENLFLLFQKLEDEGHHTFDFEKIGKNMYNVGWEE